MPLAIAQLDVGHFLATRFTTN